MRRRSALDFIGALSARSGAALLAFAANLLLARLLGPEGYGRYMTILSAALVSAGIAAYGVGPLVTREIAGSSNADRSEALLGILRWASVLVCRISSAMMLMLGAWLFLGLGAPSTDWVTRIGAILVIPVAAGSTLIGAVLAGQSKVARGESVHNLVKNVVLIFGVLAFYFLDQRNISWILGLQVAGLFCAVSVGVVWIAHGEKLRTASFLSQMMRAHLSRLRSRKHAWHRSARNFFVISSATLFLGRLDIILVNGLARPYEAGIYAAAVRVGQVAALVGMVWVAWLQPRVSATLHENRKYALSTVLLRAWVGVCAMTFGVAVVGWFFAPELSRLLGAHYGSVVTPLRWLLIGYVVWSIGVPAYVLLGMSQHEGLLARAVWVQVIATLIGTALLVPTYGAVGAVAARVGGFALATSVFLVAALRVWPRLIQKPGDEEIGCL